MNAIVEFVTGRCTNTLFCTVASNGDMVRLPAGARFVCAHCGKALVPASQPQARSALATGLIFGVGLAVTGGSLFAIGALLGGNPAPPALSPLAAPLHASATPKLPPAQAMAARPTLPAPRTPAASVTVPARDNLAAKIEALRQEDANARTAARTQAAQQSPRVSALARAAVPAEPPPPARLAPPPPLAVAAPPQGGPARAFSPHPIAGGAPAYPADYDEDARPGAVTVNCYIDTNGAPRGCRLVQVTGGRAFGSAVMRWLASGRVRYAPVLVDGRPAAGTRQWTVGFRP